MSNNVKEMEQVPIGCVKLSKVGRAWFNVSKSMHAGALKAHYGRKIPKPQASLADDGRLLLWWDLEGWPLYISIDHGQWKLR